MPELEGLTYEERLKEMHPTIMKERERGDLITIYKFTNNFEETSKKHDIEKKRRG